MRFLCVLAVILGTSVVSHAQATFVAKRIVFKNHGGFTQKQLEDAAGMHIGDKVNAAALTAAAQRLIDSGYFDNVQAAFGGTGAVPAMNFDLTPTSRASMMHTGFENFVWLTHEELEAAIQAKLPLFNGYLTENSAQVDILNAALTEALAAKSVQATVTHDSVEPTLIHPERVLEFRVSKPAINVVNIKLTGATAEFESLFQKSVYATERRPYNDGLAGNLTTDSILAPLLDAGYIEASLSNVSVTPVAAPESSIGIVLSASVQPGEVYHVSHLVFAGTPLLAPEALSAKPKLQDGDIASRKALLETLRPLDSAYRRQGYMDVVIDSGAKLDHARHTVDYTITVTPGEQYRIHELKPQGLTTAAQADFDRTFQMKAGTIYNPEYIGHYILNKPGFAISGYNVNFRAYADPNTHTVDLVLNFYKGPARQEVTVH